jgi:hypothetical protein
MMTIATHFYPQRDAEGAANRLIREAADRWQAEQGMVDDITIIIAFLNVGGTSFHEQDASSSNGGCVPAVKTQ